ncbi:MAG: glycoside hydrolase family 13 protein [Phycisphaeraceae bacterium]|nr:glycoside hydrolase family 13 protein [Phycisphaeraceae bacterium]
MKTLVCYLMLFSPVVVFAQKIDRVEPPFWWVGMKKSSLQVMLYGEALGSLKPEVARKGVRINRTASVENPNYLFVYLDIASDTSPGNLEIKLKNQRGQVECRFDYPLRQREKGAAQRKGYDTSDVMVLITPDRFANGDVDNDAVDGLLEQPDRGNSGGRHGGDILGIQNSLDYLADMGFTAVWLNPVLENNQERYSYHGYSTTDFYRVDPRFGSNEAYKDLSAKAKENGMKLIMDMIVNHCGSGHWWMKDLPSSDWLNHPDNYFMTNHRRTTLRDPYTSDHDRQHFTEGWFVPTMPDMNQKNPLVADYLIQNSIWWIESINLGGIRMDTYSYADMTFMSDWTCAVMHEYPEFNMCGEEWSLNPAVLATWQKGKENADGYRSCLPGLLDFPLQHALTNALLKEEAWNGGMIELYEMLSNDFVYADPFKHVIFPDNHDMSRIFSQLNEDYGLFRLAMVYFATMRGTPQFYYGTEILMSNTGDNSHGNIRSDFPGGWPGDPVNAFTREGLAPQQAAAQRFVKKLLDWRQSATVIHTGKLMHFVPRDGVYVYFRYNGTHKVMVVLNKSDKQQVIDLKQFSEVLEPRGKDVLSGKDFTLKGSLTVDARQPLIIEIE